MTRSQNAELLQQQKPRVELSGDELIIQQLTDHIAAFMSGPTREGHSMLGIFFHQDNSGAWKARFFTKKRGEASAAWEDSLPHFTRRERILDSPVHANEEIVRWDDLGEVRYQVNPRSFNALNQMYQPALIQVNGGPREIIDQLLIRGPVAKSAPERHEILSFLQQAFSLPT